MLGIRDALDYYIRELTRCKPFQISSDALGPFVESAGHAFGVVPGLGLMVNGMQRILLPVISSPVSWKQGGKRLTTLGSLKALWGYPHKETLVFMCLL